MSVDRDFTIRLNTIADNAGAKAAEDSIKQVGKASEETGEVGKKSAEGMFESHHELHRLLHAIGNDAVPGIGQAFSALAMGPLGAVVALATAVEFVRGKIAETNKQLDEMAATASRAFGGGDWLTDYVNAAAQAATATADLEAAMKKAADAGDPVKNKYDAEAKAIQSTVAALKAKLEAEEQADLLAARKSGASPDVIAATEADIHSRYGSRSQAVQDAADRELQIARQRELFERQSKADDLKAAAQGAQTPIDVTVRRGETQTELKANEDALAKAMSEANTAENDGLKERIESNKALLEDSRKRYGASDPLGLMKKLQDETDKLESETAEGRADAARQRIKQLSAQVIKDQQDGTDEKTALEEATNAATENTKRIVELQKEIAAANTSAQIKAQSASELIKNLTGFGDVKTFEKAAGVDTGSGMADFVQKFSEAQSRLQSHHGTKGDQQTIVLMNTLLTATQTADQATHAALEQAIQAIIRHKEETKRRFEAVMRTMESKK